jgi:hypothetical protein
MKKIIFTFTFFLLVLAPHFVYAANTSIIANYPAPNGTYNKVVLQGLYVNPACATVVNGVYVNAGMLYMYTDPATNRQTLEMCTQDGSASPVHYPETCFNRFWNSTATLTSCPTGYGPSNLIDTLASDNNTTIKVTSCCSKPDVDGTNTLGTVNPCTGGSC